MTIRTGGNLDVDLIIRLKCKEFHHNEWVGHLQPAEIVALYNAGYFPYYENGIIFVEWAKRNMKKGQSEPFWYYFNIRPNTRMKKNDIPGLGPARNNAVRNRGKIPNRNRRR